MAGPWRPRHMVNISPEWRLGHADGVELDSPRAQRRWSSFRCSNLAVGAWQRGCKRAICGPRRLLRMSSVAAKRIAMARGVHLKFLQDQPRIPSGNQESRNGTRIIGLLLPQTFRTW